jgi:DNA polymerase-3 subunit epsilon
MRDKLHAYLLERPSGATPGELLDLIFTQPGADREFGPRFLHLLLSADTRFAFEPNSSRWVATAHTALARRLDDTEFVVVDLETTGGAPSIDAGARGHGIIEIGALRLRGGRIVERFSSLVHPGRRLPFFITQLTGITDAMLAEAPTIDAILPRFIDFAADAVLIAHNAAFDLAFLDTARVQLSGATFDQPHLCTLRLARRLTPQLRRRSLDALGGFFGIPLVDRHRAMGDARITAELFFHFLELARRRGIVRLAELLDLQHCAADGRRFVCQLPRAQVLRLPRAPGIYRFTDEAGRLLYVGKARNLRQRVGSYLVNASTQRRTVLDLIRHVRDVAVEATGSELEASLREAEEIRRCQPPYNKLGKHLPRIAFLKLTLSDPFPRLMITNRLPAARRAAANGWTTGRGLFGPFRSRAAAQHAQHLVARLFSLRTCTGRLTPDPDVTPCLQGQIGACSAPCTTAVDRVAYAEQVAAAERFFAGETDAAAAALEQRRDRHSAARRFEAAAKAQRELELVRRMGRRQRTMSWIVARQHFAVMQAAADGLRALLYGVVHGRLVARGTAHAPADLADFADRLDAQLRAAQPRTAEPQDIDGSVILAAWLRERGERDGYVFPLSAEAPVHTQLPEWEAALESVLRLEPVAAAEAGAGSARRRRGGAGAG